MTIVDLAPAPLPPDPEEPGRAVVVVLPEPPAPPPPAVPPPATVEAVSVGWPPGWVAALPPSVPLAAFTTAWWEALPPHAARTRSATPARAAPRVRRERRPGFLLDPATASCLCSWLTSVP